MEKEIAQQRVRDAVQRLLDARADLLRRDVGEPALTNYLGRFFEDAFEDHDVDCEYNRNKRKTKRLGRQRIVPDVLIHEQGTNRSNYVVIEVKETTNTQKRGDEDDFDKLRGLRDSTEFHYPVIVFIRLTTGREQVGAIVAFERETLRLGEEAPDLPREDWWERPVAP